MQLTPEEIQRICSTTSLEYNDTIYKFTVHQATTSLYLHIDGNAPDTRDKTKQFEIMWREPIPNNVTRPELLKTIHGAVIEMISHEVRECLKFEGVAIFNEHDRTIQYKHGVAKLEE